jgi:hypothetical protein
VNYGFGMYKALRCVVDLLIQCLDAKRAHSPPRMRLNIWKKGRTKKIWKKGRKIRIFCHDIQDGKKKVRRRTQLFAHLENTFAAYFMGLPMTRVESFYFIGYPIGAVEKHAFSMFGRTLVSLLLTLRSWRVVNNV